MAEEDTSFADGFAAVNNDAADHTPPPTPEKPEPAPVEEPPVDDAEIDAALAEPQILPGYTPEQLTQLFARIGDLDRFQSQLDKVSGHVGRVIQDVNKLKTPAEPKIDHTQFKNDYQDIATYTDDKVGEVAAQIAELKELIQTFDAKSAARLEEFALTRDHPDWQSTVLSDPYKLWLSMQPKEVQETALTTTSAAELSKVVGEYKDFSKKSTRQATNEARLTEGLAPTGQAPVRPAEPTEHDAMLSGWRSVAGTRQ